LAAPQPMPLDEPVTTTDFMTDVLSLAPMADSE
jgi:hypothetical protein